jgi:hypothetical protein
MHWLGPFIVEEIYEFRNVKFTQLDGIFFPGWVNGRRLKPFIFAR